MWYFKELPDPASPDYNSGASFDGDAFRGDKNAVIVGNVFRALGPIAVVAAFFTIYKRLTT